MARFAMPYLTFNFYNVLKAIAVVTIFFLFIQIFRQLSPLSPIKEADIDHGPSPEGIFTPVAIVVFYEALCPDSRTFVVKQLQPVLKKSPRLVTNKFVPYGKAKTHEDSSGNLTFECQHGPTECFANKIHSCAVKMITDQITQVDYVACMISDNYDPIKAGRNCAARLNIDWELILACSQSTEGNILLKQNGELTSNLIPSVKFIPTILLDNSSANQAGILKNLFKEVCAHFKTLPEECKEVEIKS